MITKLFPPYAWQTKLIATAALCVAFFMAGWVIHGWKYDAGLSRSIPKAIKTAHTLQEKADPIVDQAVKEKETVRIVYRTIKEKIYEQNDQSVCFTNDSLKLWNDAIGADPDPHRSKSAAEVTAAKASAGEGDPDAGERPGAEIVATVEQVLISAAENFQTCKEDGIMHDKLIDVLNIYKGKMCVCSQ